MNISTRALLFALLLLPVSALVAQTNNEVLRNNIRDILKTAEGKVRVAVLGIEDRDSLTFYGKTRFPMQSVFKFPLAMAVLHLVDEGKLKMDQKIHVAKADLHPNTWSPMREKYPEGNVDLTLREILTHTVSASDNNGCDILFRLAGGPKKVDEYIKSLGVKQINIVANEHEMHQRWEVQYSNWCEPWAMMQLLDILYKGKTLSEASHAFLWKAMTETSTGSKKIKGLLPAGTEVARRSGSSGTNKEGVTAASNDIGIVRLPNGKHFGIVIFVGDSKESEAYREALAAKISKAAWDYYTHKK